MTTIITSVICFMDGGKMQNMRQSLQQLRHRLLLRADTNLILGISKNLFLEIGVWGCGCPVDTSQPKAEKHRPSRQARQPHEPSLVILNHNQSAPCRRNNYNILLYIIASMCRKFNQEII